MSEPLPEPAQFTELLPDEPLFVETLQDRLEEALAEGADPEEIADLQAQLDFFLGR